MSKLISGSLWTYQNSLSIPLDAPLTPPRISETTPTTPRGDRGKTVDARNTYFPLYVPHYYFPRIVQTLITAGYVCVGGGRRGWLRAQRILWGKLNSAMTKSQGFALVGNLLDLFVLEMICGNSSRLSSYYFTGSILSRLIYRELQCTPYSTLPAPRHSGRDFVAKVTERFAYKG